MSKISKFCDIVQFLYHNHDDCFQFDFDTRTLELIVAKSYLPTQSGIFQLAQFLSFSEIVEYRQPEETQKGFTHKYPGMIAGLKTFTDYFKNCICN